MSEVYSDQVKYDEFNDFDAVFMEPALTMIFDKIRSYNTLLASQPVRYDEILAIVNEIDGYWQSLLGEEAEFSGFGLFLDENDRESGGELVRSYYENQDVIFRGATAFPIGDHRQVADAIENPEKEYHYELAVSLMREGIDQETNHVTMTGSAKVGEIASLEFNAQMSVTRARSIVAYYYPDILDDIDVEVLNEADDECDRVLKLAEYEWSLKRGDLLEDEGLKSKVKSALKIYISSLFSFDAYVGYGIQAEGEAWLLEGEKYTAINFSAGAIATILEVTWEDSPSDDEDTIRPHLKTLLHDDDKDGKPITLMIPLQSVKGLYSIRRSFHENLKA